MTYHNFDLVFPTITGSPTNPRNLYYRSFKPLLKDAGLPDIRFHDLRHTTESLMLNNGVSVLAMSKHLGHAQPSTTLDVYEHIIPSVQEKVASIIDQIITPITLQDTVPVASGCTSPLEAAKIFSPYMVKT